MPELPAIAFPRVTCYQQCPRRIWLEQYHPELEEPPAEMDELFDARMRLVRQVHALLEQSSSLLIPADRGLRSAIEQTSVALADAAITTICDASFDLDGFTFQVDVLRRTDAGFRAMTVSPLPPDPHLYAGIAVQAWALGACLAAPVTTEIAVPAAHYSPTAASFTEAFQLLGADDAIVSLLGASPATVIAARRVLAALEEPDTRPGAQCQLHYRCPFTDHCGS